MRNHVLPVQHSPPHQKVFLFLYVFECVFFQPLFLAIIHHVPLQLPPRYQAPFVSQHTKEVNVIVPKISTTTGILPLPNPTSAIHPPAI